MFNHSNKFSFVLIIAIFTLAVSLLFPFNVLADDGVPPTEAASDTTPADPPVVEVVPEQSLPQVEDTPVVSTTETVQAMSDADVVLVDENSQPIPLATEQAAELLTNSDPYIIRGTTTYSFTSADCDPMTSGAQPCSTPIQKAIDFSVNGETIFVEPGTYVEQLEITKNITLQATASGAIIQSPSVLTDFFMSGSNHNYPIVYVHNTLIDPIINASIIGFTIDGNGQGNLNYRFDGIGYYNAGGIIQGNTIQNITTTPFSGAQQGVGIFVYAPDGAAHSIVIDDNVIQNYQKNGMSIAGDGVTAEITNNTVTGAGPTSIIAQNGIQVSGGADALIQGNTVTGNAYAPMTTQSTGILFFGPGNVQIIDNHLDKNDINAYITGAGNSEVTGNTILNATFDGVFIDSTSSVFSITGNTFTGNPEGLGVNSNVDLSKLTVTNNVFDGNGVAITNYSTINTLPAYGNYWGCPDGPSSLSCDQVSPRVLYDPWLTTNPFAATTVDGGSSSTTRQTSPFLIPATGGDLITISCTNDSAVLTSGEMKITFVGLCGYDVSLNPLTQEMLPSKLKDGQNFLFALNVNLFKDNALIKDLPENAKITISFPALGVAKEWDSETNSWADSSSAVVDNHLEVDAHSGTFMVIDK